jgi:putative DNA primase/helicase
VSLVTVDFSAHIHDWEWFAARINMDGAQVRGERDVLCRCPAHDDYSPSLHVWEDADGIGCFCFAGCGRGEIEDALDDSEPSAVVQRFKPTRRERGRIVARYPYTDDLGRTIYVKRRYEPKSFDFVRPVSLAARTEGPVTWGQRITWVRGLKDSSGNYVVCPVPYHLHELRNAKQSIWIVDGEKDADALSAVGVLATCGPFGMANWPEPDNEETGESFSDPFRFHDITVVADRDEPGYKAAARLAGFMFGVACSVRVVAAASGKDAFDHLAAGFGVDEFRLVERV